MDKEELRRHIAETYNTEPERLWMKYPDYEAFRHSNNKKWFALILDAPKNRLGLSGEGVLSVVNLKCDSVLIGSLLSSPGFFPAYHMNKSHWITISLDGAVPDDTLKALLDMSFEATAVKPKKRKIKE